MHLWPRNHGSTTSSCSQPKLRDQLNAEDPLAIVLRAHLYVEAALIRKIEDAFVNTEKFDVARLRFPEKVGLAVALGKIDAADIGGLKALNSLRVRFAHRLETQLAERDELELYNALSPNHRTIVDGLRTDQLPLIGKLRCDLIGLIVASAA